MLTSLGVVQQSLLKRERGADYKDDISKFPWDSLYLISMQIKPFRYVVRGRNPGSRQDKSIKNDAWKTPSSHNSSDENWKNVPKSQSLKRVITLFFIEVLPCSCLSYQAFVGRGGFDVCKAEKWTRINFG